MCQDRVMKLLKKNKGKQLTNKYICKKLKISCANSNLLKLLKQGEIVRKEEKKVNSNGKFLIFEFYNFINNI